MAFMNTHRTIQHPATPSLAIVLLVMASPLTKGTSVLTQDLPSIARQAHIIADVTVTSSAPYWVSPAGSRAIHTRVTFQVNRRKQ